MKSDILFMMAFFIVMFVFLAGLMLFMDKLHHDDKLKQQKQFEITEKIKATCLLTAQNFVENQAHYRCQDGITYILNGLPKQEKP